MFLRAVLKHGRLPIATSPIQIIAHLAPRHGLANLHKPYLRASNHLLVGVKLVIQILVRC
jgi:hypothetical protein